MIHELREMGGNGSKKSLENGHHSLQLHKMTPSCIPELIGKNLISRGADPRVRLYT